MYKSCPLFVLTKKTELSMPVQSLLISIYPMQLFADFAVEVRGGGEGGGRRGRHNQLGTLITPVVLYGYTLSWIPIHQVIRSYVMLDRRSTNFVKSTVFFYLARLLLLCRFLYTINFYDFIFFCVFHGFL